MEMKRTTIFCLSLCVLLMSACGGGKWVDLAGIGCEDIEKMEKNKGFMGKESIIQVARAYCTQSGKTFGGDLRCGDHGAQAKCK
jgi:hypothetical protein